MVGMETWTAMVANSWRGEGARRSAPVLRAGVGGGFRALVPFRPGRRTVGGRGRGLAGPVGATQGAGDSTQVDVAARHEQRARVGRAGHVRGTHTPIVSIPEVSGPGRPRRAYPAVGAAQAVPQGAAQSVAEGAGPPPEECISARKTVIRVSHR